MALAAVLSSENGKLTPLPAQILLEEDMTFYLALASAQSGEGKLAITMTNEERTRSEALALINRRYAWRGYGSDHKLSGRNHETTFTARTGGTLVGTVTLAADSARGLDVDRTFPEEIDFFRRKSNTKLCELKKLAVECVSSSKPVLASLFHFVFIYGVNNFLGTDLLIEVNPRHTSFYKKSLGFQTVGAIRINTSVNAQSQLMWLPVSAIESAVQSRHNAATNSLYKYFLSPQQHANIVNKMNVIGHRKMILV